MSLRPLFPAVAALLFIEAATAQITLNPSPTRVIGQDSLTITGFTPNLVEGREFDGPLGIAIDSTATPPILYVSDTGNNRVLGFSGAQSFANGQKADIVIGQPDFSTTLQQGGSRTSLTTGLTSPTGITVDSSGNLYVVDSGNNRVLRYPKPFTQQGQILPDLVIGQTSFSTGLPNEGAATSAGISLASASSLAFYINIGISTELLPAQLAFDPAGNLWVADPGNNRVLRFNASVLGSNANPGPVADMVLCQTDFVTSTYSPASTLNPLLSLNAAFEPTGIAFDSSGRLYVEEAYTGARGRILVWPTQLFSGQPAAKLLGVDLNVPQPGTVSELQLGFDPGFIFSTGKSIGVADANNNRVVIFPPFEQWTGNTYQAAISVAGQPTFTTGSANQGKPLPSASTLSGPAAAVLFGSELYVADSGDNRVIVMPQSGNSFLPGVRVLGQDAFDANAPNLLEGREFDFVSGTNFDAGVTVDLNSNPPHLYVADTYNNRVLGFNDLRNLQPGQKADIVIGQPDFRHNLINYPNGSTVPTQSSLYRPGGLVVDQNGDLFVADTGNGRVLRFPAPFANYTAGQMEKADIVIGQQNFTTIITDSTQRTLYAPYGVALTLNSGLLVSDAGQNRILYFRGPSSGFQTGMAATTVVGQSTFTGSAAGNAPGQLSNPHHISTDVVDRVFVADTGNGRVSVWDSANGLSNGTPAAATLTTGLRSPKGLYVSPTTNDIWVADPGANAALRYYPYAQLLGKGSTANTTIAASAPLAVAQDGWGDLILADSSNRVTIYYPGLGPTNAASYLRTGSLAPGMITSLFSQGNTNQFGTATANAPAYQFPLPTQLGGLEVLLNNQPMPLFYTGPQQINFLTPNYGPQSGTYDLQVQEVATGRVLGDTTVIISPSNPGLFSQDGTGSGVLVALNKDGKTLNDATHPATQGDTITIFGTGEGFVPGAPLDGYPATTATSSPKPIVAVIGFDQLADSDVVYSGLAPGLVGVWQLNLTIPIDVITTPTNPTYVEVLTDSNPSGGPTLGRAVQIYVQKH